MLQLILTLTLSAILYLTLAVLAFVIGLRLFFEPVKGVCSCSNKLNGKVALVTGGNSGIGLETARALARRGARVILASRDRAKSARAVADIVSSTGNALVEHRHLDLARFSSVRQFAEDFNRTEPQLHILVNNAGCLSAKAGPSEDGIDLVTQVNYFGPFLLTNLLLDKLIASKPSRIVVVSSLAHRFSTFDPNDIVNASSSLMNTFFNIYANSKLLQIFWIKALAKRLPLGVTVNALHPGIVQTELCHTLPPFLQYPAEFIISAFFKTAEEGAHTSTHLCVAPELEKASGGYYSDCLPCKTRAVVNNDRIVEKIWRESLILTKSPIYNNGQGK